MIATWLRSFDISKVDKKNWDFGPNIIFLERRQYVLFFQLARNFCRADLISINPKKNSNETLLSDCLGKGFEIPAHEENRIFKVKSVIGFWRLLNTLVTCT